MTPCHATIMIRDREKIIDERFARLIIDNILRHIKSLDRIVNRFGNFLSPIGKKVVTVSAHGSGAESF